MTKLTIKKGGFNLEQHLKGIEEALKGVRMNFKPSMREILKTCGDIPIIEIYICRRPITSQFKKIVDTINRYSGFEGMVHDKLFHLFFILTLTNNKRIVLEKNEDLNIDYYKLSNVDEIRRIMTTRQYTMNELLKNAINTYGNKRIFEYDAFNTNCQKFVMDIIMANDIEVNQDDINFIIQDVKNLLPKWAQRLTHYITSFYNRLKMAIYGYGMKNIKNMGIKKIETKYIYNMDEVINSLVGGAKRGRNLAKRTVRKPTKRTARKTKRDKPMSAYHDFMSHYMKQGLTMAEAAKKWNEYKKGK